MVHPHLLEACAVVIRLLQFLGSDITPHYQTHSSLPLSSLLGTVPRANVFNLWLALLARKLYFYFLFYLYFYNIFLPVLICFLQPTVRMIFNDLVYFIGQNDAVSSDDWERQFKILGYSSSDTTHGLCDSTCFLTFVGITFSPDQWMHLCCISLGFLG